MFVLKVQIVPIHAGLIKYDDQTDSTLEKSICMSLWCHFIDVLARTTAYYNMLEDMKQSEKDSSYRTSSTVS